MRSQDTDRGMSAAPAPTADLEQHLAAATAAGVPAPVRDLVAVFRHAFGETLTEQQYERLTAAIRGHLPAAPDAAPDDSGDPSS